MWGSDSNDISLVTSDAGNLRCCSEPHIMKKNWKIKKAEK